MSTFRHHARRRRANAFCWLLALGIAAGVASVQAQPLRVEAQELTSAHFPAPVPFHVVLPDSYDADPERRYPVVFWLHGSFGSSARASTLVANLFARPMRSGTIPELILVVPDGFGQGMWVNWKDGSMPIETMLITELLPQVDAAFRTLTGRESRLLEGGSMGGYGAARLGFKYPNLFSAVSMLSAGPVQEVLRIEDAPIVGREGAQRVLQEIFGGDETYFREQSPWVLAAQNKKAIRDGIALRMIVGAADPVLEDNQVLSDHLNALGIEHRFTVLNGIAHSPQALFQALARSDDYWSFFMEALGPGSAANP